MSEEADLGFLLEAFVNRISHPRGLALAFMANASVTVPQAILMNHARMAGHATPSALAREMRASLPSVSQMVDRLVNLGLLRRCEDSVDRRRRAIAVTLAGRAFLDGLRAVRAAEFEASTAALTDETHALLRTAVSRALEEIGADGAPD